MLAIANFLTINMAARPLIKDIITPANMLIADISAAVPVIERYSYSSTAPLAMIIGIDNIKLNETASLSLIPISFAAFIVLPLRLSPGSTASP